MGFDQAKSYKLKNGVFVERTPEEQAELERKRAAHLAATGVRAAAKLPKSQERFIRVTLSQADRLRKLKPPAFVTVFLLLSAESFRAHGRPFILPVDTLDKWGFSRCTQWRAVIRLANAGLIQVERVPSKQPKITLL
jgi:hypothetical protein